MAPPSAPWCSPFSLTCFFGRGCDVLLLDPAADAADHTMRYSGRRDSVVRSQIDKVIRAETHAILSDLQSHLPLLPCSLIALSALRRRRGLHPLILPPGVEGDAVFKQTQISLTTPSTFSACEAPDAFDAPPRRSSFIFCSRSQQQETRAVNHQQTAEATMVKQEEGQEET